MEERDAGSGTFGSGSSSSMSSRSERAFVESIDEAAKKWSGSWEEEDGV